VRGISATPAEVTPADRPGGGRPITETTGGAFGRRLALAGMLGFCTGIGARSTLAQLAPEAARARPQPGDVLVGVPGDDHRPLTVADVPPGQKPIMAWPLDPATDTVRGGSRLNKVLLLRLDPESFDAQTKANAADGVVAYSAICPHTGCEVTNWQAGAQVLECPCHYSHYDPKAGAKVLSGPSPRRLAALPLTADGGGRLVVARPFVGRVGVQQQS
jgi:rieske iron-sulfur protein